MAFLVTWKPRTGKAIYRGCIKSGQLLQLKYTQSGLGYQNFWSLLGWSLLVQPLYKVTYSQY